MKIETIRVTIKCEGQNQFKPHYLSSERTFKVDAHRGRLFQSLDSMEKKLVKKYPVELALLVPENDSGKQPI